MLAVISYLVIPFILSIILTTVVKYVGDKLDVVAKMNSRTIHTKRIVRMGGVAIYLSFIISLALLMKVDVTLNGIIVGGTIMFFGGLIDDMVELNPLAKILFQVVAVVIVMSVGGINLDIIHLPLGVTINMGLVSYLITFLWLMGITNAVNLIDGLDGLAAGIIAIVLCVYIPFAIIDNRPDIIQLCLVLIGAIGGFIIFNFYPASIFMGDCGALFLGFMVASISLLGFKNSTIISLALPILMLAVPIFDTLTSILRRLIAKKRVSQADKKHLHHILMERFGQRNTVLILHAFTALLGIVAYIYLIDNVLGFILLIVLGIVIEIFMEKSEIISTKYQPILWFINTIKQKLKIK